MEHWNVNNINSLKESNLLFLYCLVFVSKNVVDKIKTQIIINVYYNYMILDFMAK